MDLETRQLRYFVAVATELHFGRAAEQLGIAQPPLSRAISAMERQLGVRLLERTTRSVSLTPAGTVLLEEARLALAQVSAAAARARAAGAAGRVLRVALKADYDGGLLPRVLDRLAEADPELDVAPVLVGRGEQALAVREGRADVALAAGPLGEAAGLEAEPLLTEPRLVALAADDPLAAREELVLADLAGRRRPDGGPADDESAPAPTGSAPLATDLAQIFNLVELGRLVLFAPTSLVARHHRAAVAYRPVADLEPVRFHVVWPTGSRSPEVAAFVRAAVDAAEAVAVP